MTRSVPFSVILNDYLKDPDRALSYLQDALEEGDLELFLETLRDVAVAQGVVSNSIEQLPELSQLVEGFRRHGVSDEVIAAVLAEVTVEVDAA
ncbi:DNA-binding protein [Alkalinema pantanalense CENA528]|uniref:helix-turn-helix domain-containing transcriptional regulator n=1 Tax=Alkalinema pantanalense TaxID=1620705 RepID=UPI003D6DC167